MLGSNGNKMVHSKCVVDDIISTCHRMSGHYVQGVAGSWSNVCALGNKRQTLGQPELAVINKMQGNCM